MPLLHTGPAYSVAEARDLYRHAVVARGRTPFVDGFLRREAATESEMLRLTPVSASPVLPCVVRAKHPGAE